MRYFETHKPYYAIMAARSKEEAIEIYTRDIADNEDDCLQKEMKEVTQLEAFLKFAASAKDEMGLTTVGQALDEFHNSDILLLDNALLYLQMILYTVL